MTHTLHKLAETKYYRYLLNRETSLRNSKVNNIILMQIRRQQKPTKSATDVIHHVVLFTSSFHVLMLCSRFRPEGNSKVLKEFHARSAWLLINQTHRAWPALSRLHMSLNVHPTYTTALVYWSKFVLVWTLNIIYPYNLSIWIICGIF